MARWRGCLKVLKLGSLCHQCVLHSASSLHGIDSIFGPNLDLRARNHLSCLGQETCRPEIGVSLSLKCMGLQFPQPHRASTPFQDAVHCLIFSIQIVLYSIASSPDLGPELESEASTARAVSTMQSCPFSLRPKTASAVARGNEHSHL